MPLPSVDPKKVRIVLTALRDAGREGITKKRLRKALESHVVDHADAPEDREARRRLDRSLDKLIERAVASLVEDEAAITRSQVPPSRETRYVLRRGPHWDEHIPGEARLALKLAAMTLSQTGTALWHEKLHVIEAIASSPSHMSERDHKLFSQLDQAIHVYGGTDDPKEMSSEDILEPILKAFETKRMVRVEYQAAGTTGTVKLTVAPYALTHDLFSGGAYLLVWDPTANLPKPLRLNRIASVEPLTTPAVITSPEVMARAVTYQVGAWASGEPPFEVKLRIHGRSWVQSLQEAPPSLPDFETSLEDGGKSLLVTFKANKEEGALRWILQFGSCAEILEPPFLRERLKQELQRTLERY